MSEQKRKCKIIQLVGLPASGKSTRARELMNDGNIMRVNRDELRRMLFKKWQGKKEGVVTDIEKHIIRSVVSAGYDIVIDDTNLSPRTSSSWKNLAMELGVSCIEETFPTPIEECIRRDSLRQGPEKVGRVVIENMALRYNLIPKPDQPVVIFDVDGTLANCMHRKTYLNVCRTCNEIEEFHGPEAINECQEFIPGKKNHKIFYAKASEDTPIQTVIDWCNSCYNNGYYVVIVSGRPADLAGETTVQWLHEYGVSFHHIFMRAGGDFRDDTIVKKEILDKILLWISKEQLLFAVDDRPRVIRMWQANGIKCFDVGEGVEF